jgi:flagellar capping protein FliD
MGASNRTPSRRFPRFVESDKPSFLGDWNQLVDMIDNEFIRLDNRINEMQSQINTLQNRK